MRRANVGTYAARTNLAVRVPTGTVRVNRSVDAARTRAIALFQLSQPLLGVFQLFVSSDNVTFKIDNRNQFPIYLVREQLKRFLETGDNRLETVELAACRALGFGCRTLDQVAVGAGHQFDVLHGSLSIGIFKLIFHLIGDWTRLALKRKCWSPRCPIHIDNLSLCPSV